MGFDHRISTGLGKTETPVLESKQNLLCAKTQGKGAVTSQETEPDLPLILEGLLWRHALATARQGDKGTGSSSPGRGRLAEILFGVAINPTIEPEPQANHQEARATHPSADN